MDIKMMLSILGVILFVIMLVNWIGFGVIFFIVYTTCIYILTRIGTNIYK